MVSSRETHLTGCHLSPHLGGTSHQPDALQPLVPVRPWDTTAGLQKPAARGVRESATTLRGMTSMDGLMLGIVGVAHQAARTSILAQTAGSAGQEAW